MGRLYDEPYTMQHRASDGTTLVMQVQRVGYDPGAMWEAQVHGQYTTRSWGRLRRDALAAAADKWARLQLPPRRQHVVGRYMVTEQHDGHACITIMHREGREVVVMNCDTYDRAAARAHTMAKDVA